MDQGWADPRKLSQASAKARNLRARSLESLAENLGHHPDRLAIVGESALANYFALAGIARGTSTFIHSAIDRKEVFAFASTCKAPVEQPVDRLGHIQFPTPPIDTPETLVALQGANIETGTIQPLEKILTVLTRAKIALDFTSTPTLPLPSRWSTVAYNAHSWQGPEGIGLIAIAQPQLWTNPLPHLGPERVPESFSLPLLLAAAVALEHWIVEEKQEHERIRQLSKLLRQSLSTRIKDCDIAGDLDSSLPHISSISFLYVHGEEILRQLELQGFSVDSGSACSADNLQPSHVLAAMGVLTHGNIRVTLHHGVQEKDLLGLVEAISTAVATLRFQ